MLAALLTIPYGSTVVKFPFKKIGIRRLIVSSPHNYTTLNYDGTTTVQVSVLVDYVPDAPINSDYF